MREGRSTRMLGSEPLQYPDVKTKKDTALSGLWAVTWRSLFLTPVGVLAFVFLMCPIIAMIFLPIFGGVCFFYGLWWQGIIAVIVWVVVIWAWRHFRLSRFFKGSSSLLC